MSDNSWEDRLESAPNYQAERLVFREHCIKVRPTWKAYLVVSIFWGVGLLLLLLCWAQEAWPLLVFGCIMLLLGIWMIVKIVFAKRPYLDLETRQFYPEGRRSDALPLGIGEFHRLEIASKLVTKRSKSGFYSYPVFSLNAVTRSDQCYPILQHGSEKIMREEAKRLAEALFLSLSERETEPATPPRDWSKAVQKNKKLLFLPRILFGLAFVTVAVVFGWLEVVTPCRKAIASRSWPTTIAKITSSELQRGHSGKGSSTYKIEIEFEYQVDELSYTSEQYDFFSSMYTNVGVARMREIVSQHPVGAEVICRYDAENPSEAVISSEIPGRVWLFGFFFLVFAFPGVFVIWITLKEK